MTERNEVFFIGRPVHSLQAMLRELSYENQSIPRLVPDGVFGERTLEGVMVFQRDGGLPVNGVVDRHTWKCLAREYRRAYRRRQPPTQVQVYPSHTFRLEPGESNPQYLPVQAMYQALSQWLEEIEGVEVDGIHAGASVKNTELIQKAGGLEPTGIMEKETWELLNRLYTLFAIRSQQPGVVRRQAADT